MEARRLRDQFAVEVRAERILAADKRKAKFADVATEWLTEREKLKDDGIISPRTFEKEEIAVRRHFLSTFGQRPMAAITPEEIIRWHREATAAGQSRWSVSTRYGVLSLIFTYGERHNYLTRNPIRLLARHERPRPGKPRQRALSAEEIGTLLKLVPDRLRLPIKLAFFAGLRTAEISGLRWRDVDLAEQAIRVEWQFVDGAYDSLKSDDSERWEPLPPFLLRALRRHKLASPFSADDDPVIASPRIAGRPMDKRSLARALNRALKGTRFEGDVCFHVLRHSFGTWMALHDGAGLHEVYRQHRMGHADPAIMRRTYIHEIDKHGPATVHRELLEREFASVIES